jgi:hypothetical protein
MHLDAVRALAQLLAGGADHLGHAVGDAKLLKIRRAHRVVLRRLLDRAHVAVASGHGQDLAE